MRRLQVTHLNAYAIDGQLRKTNAGRKRCNHTAQTLDIYHTVCVRYIGVKHRGHSMNHGAWLRGASSDVGFNAREILQDGRQRA
jgi:hypothetical protein